jgi:hypothetical protein
MKKSDSNKRLYLWIRRQCCQSKEGKEGKMSESKYVKLDSVGFPWDPRKDMWDHSFNQYAEFVAKNEVLCVPENTSRLSEWIIDQRKSKGNGIMREGCETKLNEIGFRWKQVLKEERTEPKWLPEFATRKRVTASHVGDDGEEGVDSLGERVEYPGASAYVKDVALEC